MKTKTNTKSFLKGIILLLAISLGVGYAAITSTISINGTTKISQNKWDVHFETVSVTANSVSPTTAATIGSDKLSVSYNVTLSKPGDFYEFTVNVKNAGTIAAKLSAAPTLSGVSTAQDVYTNYTVKYSDGTAPKAGDTIAVNGTRTIKVRVEYDTNITASQLPTADQSMTLTYSMNYIQA